jgi:hypothetical protein
MSEKINNASLKVFKTLLSLYGCNLTMEELIDVLDKTGDGPYNNFVVSKYINTCKSCSVDIQKFDGKYSLVNFPFGEKYTEKESELLCDFVNIIKSLEIDDNDEYIEKLLLKLHLPYFKGGNGLKSSENYRLIRLFDKACVSETDINILFTDRTTKTYSPVQIHYQDEKIYFKVKSGSQEELIEPENVLEIEPLDKSARHGKSQPEVVEFILKGKLAKRYQPRENEIISLFKRNGDIVITNKYEDKDALLRRLMRYDSLCN